MPRKPTEKQLLAAEGIAQGKAPHRAYRDAGYSESVAKTAPYRSENLRIRELVEKRKAEVAKLAQIHTDVITGWLVEMATVTADDILDDQGRFSLKKARQTGAIHAIKRIEKKGKDFKVELYPRLDAIAQLRDNFGMKQEPRANTYEATRQAEVEKELEKIMQAEDCSKPEAAKMLLEALGGDSPLIPTVNKYVN